MAAKAHGGGRTPGADAATCRVIESLVAAHNDHTLDRSALGRTLRQLGLTRRKRRSATTSTPPRA